MRRFCRYFRPSFTYNTLLPPTSERSEQIPFFLLHFSAVASPAERPVRGSCLERFHLGPEFLLRKGGGRIAFVKRPPLLQFQPMGRWRGHRLRVANRGRQLFGQFQPSRSVSCSKFGMSFTLIKSICPKPVLETNVFYALLPFDTVTFNAKLQ